MRSLRLACLLALLVSLPAAGASRILVENRSDPSARVVVGFAAGETARLTDAGDGEVTVDAPSPKRRLRGGSLQTDPRIELIAGRELRESSNAPALQIVDTGFAPATFAPVSGPLVYDDWPGSWGGDYWGAGWYGPAPGRSPSRGIGRDAGERRTRGERARPAEPRSSPSGGMVRARGVIAHSRR